MRAPNEKRPAGGNQGGASERGRSGNRPQSEHSTALHDVHVAFVNALANAGIPPADPSALVLDGTMRRYLVNGDKPSRLNGWYLVHVDDHPAGRFGSWKAGIAMSWRLQGSQPLTIAERNALRERGRETRRRRAAQISNRHTNAASRAADIWAQACPVSDGHPYINAKRIRPHGARQRGDCLVLQLIDVDGRLWSLQFIDASGNKRMLKGGRKRSCMICVAGDMAKPYRVLVAEGWATSCTLADAEPGSLVLAAIDAGNLEPVAVDVRRRWPNAEIVVCADADDIGRAKGRAAAITAGALLAVPEFPPGVAGSDFNDLALAVSGGAG